MQNGIVKVHIENFKKITNVDVDLNGKSIFLIGDNEVGKSSFMQAVFSILSNEKLPEKIIHEGQKDAKVEIKFRVDGREYIAIKKFTEKNPKGYFEIQTDDGLKTERVSFLESLVGNISFNPFEFVDMCKSADGRRRQVEFLRKLIDPEINKKIDDINRTWKMAYDSRTRVNATVTQLDGEIAGINVPDPDVYKEKLNVDELMAQLTQANVGNNKRTQLRERIDIKTRALTETESIIERLKRELAAQEKERERLTSERTQLETQFKATPPVTTTEIETKIKSASEHNSKVETVKRYNDLKARYQKTVEEARSLSDRLMGLATDKSKLISESNLPVDGLTFDENGLYVNQLPLTEDQVATSVIMDLGVRIAVALNPKLKILRVPRGESLGKKRLDEIVMFAHKNGYQLFIERVESGVDKLTIQFIEQ